MSKPDTPLPPPLLRTPESLHRSGGLDAYLEQLEAYIADITAPPIKRKLLPTKLIHQLLRVLCLSSDFDCAKTIPRRIHQVSKKEGYIAKERGPEKLCDTVELREHLGDWLDRSLTFRLTKDVDMEPEIQRALLLEEDSGAATLAIRDIMGPILNRVSASSQGLSVRAAHAAQIVRSFESRLRLTNDAYDMSTVLQFRCLVLWSVVKAAEGNQLLSLEPLNQWLEQIPCGWLPAPLADAIAEIKKNSCLHTRDIGESTKAFMVIPKPPPLLLVSEVSNPPEGIIRASRIAVKAWGARHGAVVVASDSTYLAEGFNQADQDAGRPKKGKHRMAGYKGKHVLHAEMAALRCYLEAGGSVDRLQGSVVYIARLAKQDESFEDAAPCCHCEGVLRTLGVQRAIYTVDFGRCGTLELCPDDKGDGSSSKGERSWKNLSPDQVQWMGIDDDVLAQTEM